MLIVKFIQRNITRQQCIGYLFHKIGVTATQNVFKVYGISTLDQLPRFLVFGHISMTFNKKAVVARNCTAGQWQYNLLLGLFTNSLRK